MKIPANALPDDLHIAETILLNAAAQIRRAHEEHGHTHLSFTMVGELWSTYITHIFTMRGSNKLEPQDIAHMLGLLKKARSVYGYSEDNFVDEAGYTSLAAMLTAPPKPKQTPIPNVVTEQPAYEPPAPKRERTVPRMPSKTDPMDHPLLKPTRYPTE